MLVLKENIDLHIPQRAPFVMIDNLIEANEDSFTSDFEIGSDNLFVQDNEFEIYGLIENIAQTTAAGLSIVINDPSKKREDGFLGSITNLISLRNPLVGEIITTRIHRLASFENMYKIKGECFVGEQLLLSCEIKIIGIQN